jgi:hypothetical protein
MSKSKKKNKRLSKEEQLEYMFEKDFYNKKRKKKKNKRSYLDETENDSRIR